MASPVPLHVSGGVVGTGSQRVLPTTATLSPSASHILPSSHSGYQLYNTSQAAPSASPSRVVSTGQHTVTSERVMSTAIIGEQQLNPAPEDKVHYVEVPVIEEVVRHVPKKEIVEIEKRVPRYEYEWVERIVEVPQIQIVDKHVDVPQIHEVIRHVPVKQVVDVPREVVKYVPKIETKIIEQEVEVAGETIEVPKPYLVENRVVVPRYIDKEVPTVVAQRMHPIITESEVDFVDVELKEYNPQLIPVDVYIPRPVARNLVAGAKYEEHRVVDVPPAQYNALVKNLNGHMSDADAETMYCKMLDGSVPMLHGLGSSIVPPLASDWEKYHHRGQSHIILTPDTVLPTMAQTGTVHSAGLSASRQTFGNRVAHTAISKSTLQGIGPTIAGGQTSQGKWTGAQPQFHSATKAVPAMA